jgi:hypothetical protein
LTNLYSFYLSNSIDQNKVSRKPYASVVAVEWRRWQRRRPMKTAAVVQEVRDADGGDWQSRERRELRVFWDEKQNDTG